MRCSFLFLGLTASLLAGPAAWAQPLPAAAPERKSAPGLPPSLPPLSPSPLDYFRQILAMSAPDREKLLAGKAPAQRQSLEAKLREYEALAPEEREARLRALQLRWYLLPLMKMPPGNRPERLAAIPESDRKLIVERLGLWDKLPEDLQKEVLENEAIIRFFYPAGKGSDGTNVPPPSPQQQEQMARIARWQALSESKRDRIYEQFQKFFELDPQQKARTLDALTEAERRQMEKTLQVFEKLPKEQRDRCLSGFRKFADLSLEERQEFLKNAERWQQMSAAERQVWRRIVARVASPPPPLPPGIKQTPPLPPRRFWTNN
jgi:hypothetical protein